MKKNIWLPVICGVGILSFLSFRDIPVYQEPWKAPAEADTLKSPFTYSPEVIREGEKLYQIYCASCHGKTGLGDGSPGKFKIEPANFHSKTVMAQTDGAIFWKMSTGRGIMPAYGKALSEEVRWQLVAYIRQLSKQDANNLATFRPVLPLNNYRLKEKTTSAYFPIPQKLANAVNTERQLFTVDTVLKGLTRPWSMAFLPDGGMLIAERQGTLQLVRNGTIQGPVQGNLPPSLRDVKLHPDFKNNGLIYLSYYIEPVRPEGGYTVLMRGKLTGNRLTEDKILYKAGPFRGNGEWYGSKIAFDRKGHIFFTVGIRGDRKNSQDLSNPEGKTMRFKEDGSIPADNPFINTPGALPEIYSYGHRVHEGLGYDPVGGKILSTEFGELGGDELNEIKAGANYGWPIVSYSLEYDGRIISENPLREGIEPPVHHFAIAPSDFEIITGDKYPEWKGNIFIGGLAAKTLYRIELKAGKVTGEETMIHNIGRVRDVKMAPDGFLYALTEDNGLLVRLLPLEQLKLKNQPSK